MSRKHPSFAQLIDYIEGETKRTHHAYSLYHNTYTRKTDDLKREFLENASHLKERKNGVYLYHEVVSISRSHTLSEDEQKAILQTIVREYLHTRARHMLAYAVLHEDTDNLHFHIVISANNAGSDTRQRLSKAQFAEIQHRLEAWVLRTYPTLEQKAVFYQNQTAHERKEREAHHAHLSDRGEQLKRRGGKTTLRDAIQERLTDMLETSTDPRHFAELMEQAGFQLYTRGKQYGITDQAGNKYRLHRLGLADAWDALEQRMLEVMHPAKAHTQEHTKEAPTHHAHSTESAQKTTRPEEHPTDSITEEAKKRLEEIREKRAKAQHSTRSRAKHQNDPKP